MEGNLLDGNGVDGLISVIQWGGLVSAAAILVMTYFVSEVVGMGFSKLGERVSGRRLLLHQVGAFSRFAVYILGSFLAVISAVDLREETVLALSGTAAVAVGFALKDLASSVLAGITILIDKPFQVGDRISLGETYGEVTSIGLRSVRVVTLDDNLVTIPNNRLLSDVVASANSGELTMLVQMDFYIGIDQDAKLARALMEEALLASNYCSLERATTVLVNQIVKDDYFALRLRAKAYVVELTYEKAFETDVTLRVMEAFRDHNIAPPARLTRLISNDAGVQNAA
jgi:small-conductance mechanosensitive channel